MAVSVEGLASTIKGRVVEPSGADYDESRALFNAMIDKRPAAIAYCTDEGDVAAALAYGIEHGLRIAVRGGGHNGAADGDAQTVLDAVAQSSGNVRLVGAIRDRGRPLVDHRVVERARIVVVGAGRLDDSPLDRRS